MVYQTGGNLKLTTDFMHLKVKNIKKIVKFLSYFDSGDHDLGGEESQKAIFLVKMTIEILKQSKVLLKSAKFYAKFGIGFYILFSPRIKNLVFLYFFPDFFSRLDALLSLYFDHSLFQ